MKPFAYVNPANEKDAVAALSKEYEKALPIGGGQDLLARMKDYVTQPDRLVNVKNLDATVTRADGGLRIGSAMKMVDVAEHPEIGRLDIFLVPRQPLADGLPRYDAVFN